MMKTGRELWEAIEEVGREKFGLNDEWHLCHVDIKDPDVIWVEFARRGPRGGWPRDKINRIKGFVLREKVEAQ